jgi:hypothetical protein
MTPEAKDLFSHTISKLRAEGLAGNSNPMNTNPTKELILNEILFDFALHVKALPADALPGLEELPKIPLTPLQQEHADKLAFHVEREKAMQAMDLEKSAPNKLVRVGPQQPEVVKAPDGTPVLVEPSAALTEPLPVHRAVSEPLPVIAPDAPAPFLPAPTLIEEPV